MTSRQAPQHRVRNLLTGRTPRALLLGITITGVLTVGAVNVVGASHLGETALTGQVVVFETEFLPLKAYDDLTECHNAPAGAHTIVNLSDETVTMYADDRCGVPLFELEPRMGSHVAPGQAFSAR